MRRTFSVFAPSKNKNRGVRFRIPRWRRNGFGLIEVVITIGITAMVLMVVLSITNVLQLQQTAYHRTVARQLIVEESESLRNASYADLHNRMTTPFIEMAYTNGSWAVAQTTVPDTSPNVLLVQNVTGSNNSSRIVVPAGNCGNGTYNAAFRVRAGSAAGWKVGVYLRMHDDQNHYLLQATATTLTLIKVIEGTPTTLWSNGTAFLPGTWYQLALTVNGSTFTSVSVNGTVQAGFPITDGTFARGSFVLGAFDNVQAEFDTVSFLGLGSVSWNFDGADETIGALPRGWRRMVPSDLPSGSTSITITDAQPGYTDLKQAVLTVFWNEPRGQQSLSNTFYINQQSIAP